MPITKSLLAPLLAASVLLLGTAPAVAGTEIVRDAKGDELSGPYPIGDVPTQPAPHRRVGDIVRSRVTFGTDLVVTMTFRSVAAGVTQREFSSRIRTSKDDSPWAAELLVPPGPGATIPGAAIYVLIDPANQSVHCGSGRVHKHTRTVTWLIPADCLGNPAWVRVASGATFHVSPELTYYDDARRDGFVGHRWKYGPRVTAG